MADLYNPGTRCKKGEAGLLGMTNADMKALLKENRIPFKASMKRSELAAAIEDADLEVPETGTSTPKRSSSKRAPAADKKTVRLPGVTVAQLKEALKDEGVEFKSTLRRDELIDIVEEHDIVVEAKSPKKSASKSSSRSKPGVPSRRGAKPFEKILPRFDSSKHLLGNVSWDLRTPLYEKAELFVPSPLVMEFLKVANIEAMTLDQMIQELDFPRAITTDMGPELMDTLVYPETKSIILTGVPGYEESIAIELEEDLSYADVLLSIEQVVEDLKPTDTGKLLFRGLQSLGDNKYELILDDLPEPLTDNVPQSVPEDVSVNEASRDEDEGSELDEDDE